MIYMKLSRMRKIGHSKTISIASGLVSIFVLCLALALPALAGTENGEFCPTCPDWTDLDGWLAKKEAYEQEQQQKAQLDKQELTLTTQNAQTVPVPVESDPAPGSLSRTRTGAFAGALASPADVSSDDIVLDISPSAARYIEGAVNVNYEGFFEEGGKLKSASGDSSAAGRGRHIQ